VVGPEAYLLATSAGTSSDEAGAEAGGEGEIGPLPALFIGSSLLGTSYLIYFPNALSSAEVLA